MDAEYVYCNSCGFEDMDIFVGYSRACAEGDLYICPGCGEEIYNVEIDEE